MDPRGGPAYAQVADHLRTWITSGVVQPGDRLDTENDLIEAYEVSRSTVREALRVLTSESLVETRRGAMGGTFVSVPDVDRIAAVVATSMGQLTAAGEIDVEELLFARGLLEVPVARLAAERRTNQELEAIQGCLVDPRTLSREARSGGASGFHGALVAATGSRLLDLLVQPVHLSLRRLALADGAPLAYWRTVDEDHRRIADAVTRRDGDEAAEAMTDHLANQREAHLASGSGV